MPNHYFIVDEFFLSSMNNFMISLELKIQWFY